MIIEDDNGESISSRDMDYVPTMPEIHKMLVMSTAHVSEETAKLIDEAYDRKHAWAPAFARAEGWLFYVGDENPVVKHGLDYPEEFAALFSFAMEQGCTWLMLDRDGDTVDNLPTFEW